MDRDPDQHDQPGRPDRPEQPGQPGSYPTAVSPSAQEPPRPGDLVMSEVVVPVSTTPSAPGVMGTIAPEPLVGGDEDSPLDQGEEEGPIPAVALRVLKEHRHGQWHVRGGHHHLREAAGSGDLTLYLIDDGTSHAVVGRFVGFSAEGCDYYLVGRVSLHDARSLLDRRLDPADVFSNAQELTLCGSTDVPDVLSANVFDVARYGSAEEIPAAYRVGEPPVELEQDLEITLD